MDIALTALKDVGIEHLSDRDYTKLSGGERQMVLIARAIAQDSPILVLDEPTSHLDFKNQYKILKLIKDIAKSKNITVLMTLHDPNLTSYFSDVVVMIKNGKLLGAGESSKMLTAENIKRLYDIEVEVMALKSHNLIYKKD